MIRLQKAGYLLGLMTLGSAWVILTGFKSAPVILSDEWTYRSQIAFLSFNEFSIPNYLYSAIYGVTTFFKNFYLATQILNLFFFIGFCLVLFLAARLFTDFWPAALLAFGVLISPLGLFVGLQMPDAPYFFFVSLAIFALLRSLFFSKTYIQYLVLFLGSVATFLAASFVKPHAIFFLLCSLILALVFRPKELVTLSRSLAISVICGVAWIALKLGIGFMVGGPKGFAIFGEGYEKALFERLFGLSLPTTNLASGLTLAVGTQEGFNWLPLIINFAIWFAILGGAYFIVRNQLDPDAQRPTFFMLGIISGVSAIILAFQVFVTFSGDIHTDRMLLRHFEFVFPLLLATLLARHNVLNSWTKSNPVVLAGILGAVFLFPLAPYSPNLSDSVLLYGYTGNRFLFVLLLAVVALAWFFAKKAIWVASGMVVISFLGSVLSQPQLAYRNEYSQIEQTVDSYVSLETGASIPVIVSYRKQDAASFLFLLNRGLGSYSVSTSNDELIDLGALDRTEDYLIIGNVEVLGGEGFVTLEPGYSRLYPALGTRLEGQTIFQNGLEVSSVVPNPPQNGYGPVIRSNSVVRLQEPLSPGERLKLSLLGHDESYGGETLIINLGGERFSLAIPRFTEIQEFYLEFPNSAPSDELELDLGGQDYEFTLVGLNRVRE